MSELKDYDIMDIEAMDDERLEKSESGRIQVTRVYIKSEADNVISTIRAERDEYRYNLSCARNEIHNLSMSMREDVKRIADKDKVIADLEESHKMEVEQLLMEIAGLKKLVETADKLLKQKGGFMIKDITFDGVKLEGFKKEVTNAVDKSNA